MTDLIKLERKRVHLKGIHSSAWEHPADRTALQALKSIPGLDTILKTVLSPTSEKGMRMATLASAVRVSPRQFATLHALHLEACRTLDVETVPELFVAQNPLVNAYAVGVHQPFIVLNSSILQTLRTEEEVLGVLGHELGHIKSGHVLYKTLLVVLIRLSQQAFQLPLTGVALQAVIAALREWDRKSELSADRAEALTTQNPDVVIRTLMALTGGSQVEEMDLGEFIKQAEEYTSLNNPLDTVHKLLNTLNASHPFPVIRVTELLNWVRSGEYDRILNGSYLGQSTSPTKNLRDTASAYAKDLEPTWKPVQAGAEDLARKAREAFDKFNRKRP